MWKKQYTGGGGNCPGQRVMSARLIGRILAPPGWGSVTVSPDSRRVSYGAGAGDKQFVVVDGREEKQYDAILEGTPLFSPDSRRVAYVAGVGDKQFVVVNGREEKQYDGITDSSTFQYDGQPAGGLCRWRGRQTVCRGRKRETSSRMKQYDALILEGTPHFSPDSRRVAYGAGAGDKPGLWS